jgi:hypothetical protein
MTVQKITQPNGWFNKGIPNAYDFAPWQKAYLTANTMYPDETGLIQYKLNSKGYRDKEWTDTDLTDGIWCVGHSDVFGIGVDADSTWPSLLNGINLGIAGAAWDTIARTISSGLSIYKPRCIVIQATTKERKEYVSEHCQQVVLPSMPAHLLPHNELWKYSDDVMEQYAYEKNLAFIIAECRAHDVKLIMFELEDRWALIKQDSAVDKQHIGVATHKQIAEFIKQQLQQLQIL